ncbi:MAG: sugar ABC transporter ATP-binding protein [Sphaerochaetaceae bacterium]|nr:sugar ABC transporter ATP-binding protein [Sphaerochaetaceae bacterium]
MERYTLECQHVSMSFPGVKALNNVDFTVRTGEIHALVGANGAGKSTLMKVLAGANPGYTGDLFLNGKKISIRNPFAAKHAGVQIVFQEVDTALIPSLSVAENIMLNDMIMNMGHQQLVHWSRIRSEAQKVLDRLNIQLDVRKKVADLSLAQKQMVLIARAIQSSCKFLLLDEPTAPLSDNETKDLFNLVLTLKRTEDIAIIFITHRIYEVLKICESYTAMRNGEIVGNFPITNDTSVKEIVEQMLGRSFEESFSKTPVEIGEKVFEVNHLTEKENKVRDVSLYVRKGEVVGIAGLVGAGKSELCKTIFGALKKKEGSIIYKGKELTIRTPSDAVKQNIALVPEERRKEGVLVQESVDFNLSASCLNDFCYFSFVNKKKITRNAQMFIDKLGIKTPSTSQKTAFLSGGNQQKVVIGKWLSAHCSVYIFDEPTKGVDVGAKKEIFKLINNIAAEGNSVLYATCENSEILAITDRIYVMFGGEIMAELETKKTNDKEIMYYSVGGRKPAGQQ